MHYLNAKYLKKRVNNWHKTCIILSVELLFFQKGEEMNKINRIVLIAILGLGTLSLSAAEIESNFALSNDYIWRGMTQSDEGFAYSGGVDVSGDNGAYVGIWGS